MSDTNESNVIDNVGSFKSREFWVCAGSLLFILIAAFILMWFGKINSEQWLMLMQWLPPTMAGIFAGAKTIQKFVVAKDNAASVPTVPPAVVPVTNPNMSITIPVSPNGVPHP